MTRIIENEAFAGGDILLPALKEIKSHFPKLLDSFFKIFR